jgi:predicted dehydrogenase
MRVVVIGLGVQGKKRSRVAGADLVATVDPLNPDANYKNIEDVPLHSFDAALACIPDNPKVSILKYLLANKKHVLVEKPLFAPNRDDIRNLQDLARVNEVFCYTAYNHRFEPHFVKMHDLIKSGALGKIYNCRVFYGNGTARLVRDSLWRDEGAGVLPDLGSHLLDTLNFWFGIKDGAGYAGNGNARSSFKIELARCNENRAPDHVIFSNNNGPISLQCETTLLSWRNHFTCDIFAERGSAHISSLCKWGPSVFTERTRVLPSGLPIETAATLVQSDPTWELEYQFFKRACLNGEVTDLSNDLWLQDVIGALSLQASEQSHHMSYRPRHAQHGAVAGISNLE